MPIKNLTLGLCLLLAGQALAKNCTHVVRQGDSISALAARFHTTQKAILNANGLKDRHSLSLGQRLVIPTTRSLSDQRSTNQVPLYTIRKGDYDGLIAKRAGIGITQLHHLNPGMDWDCLQIGQKLRVPGANVEKTKTSVKASRHSRRGMVAKNAVIIRRGPTQEADAITTVDHGTPVSILGRDGNWYHLRFPKGTEGWVRGDLIGDAPARVSSMPPMSELYASTDGGAPAAKNSQQKVIQTAKTYRGVRYRWGGMSRSGTDCSGFTSQVFKSQGINLPRVSTMQATVGKKVSGQLQPGDLVFFKTTRGSRISHVGIYVGNGKFIHASSGGGKVQVNSLREQYYRSRFVTARRLMKGSKDAKQLIAEEPVAEPVASIPSDEKPVDTSITTTASPDEVGN